MPLSKVRKPTKSNCRANMSRNIKLLMDEGRPQPQAVAIAYKKAREGGCAMPDTRKRSKAKRSTAKRSTAKRSAGKRASKRGMASGASGFEKLYRRAGQGPAVEQIVESFAGSTKVGFVRDRTLGSGPKTYNPRYLVEVWDLQTERPIASEGGTFNDLSSARRSAESALHSAPVRQKLTYTPPGAAPAAPARQKLTYTPPGRAMGRLYSNGYVLWDEYMGREVAESRSLDQIRDKAEAYARAMKYSKPRFTQGDGELVLWEDLDKSGHVRLSIHDNRVYGGGHYGHARGTANRKGRAGGRMSGYEAMPVMSPEFKSYWKKTRGLDLDAAVARAKHKTAIKSNIAARQKQIYELIKDYDAFMEAGMLYEASIIRRAVYTLQSGGNIDFTLPQVPARLGRSAGRAGRSGKAGAAFGKTRKVVLTYDVKKHGKVVTVDKAGEVRARKTFAGKGVKVGQIKRKTGHAYFGKGGKVYEAPVAGRKASTSSRSSRSKGRR